jgi:5'-3' exonuclease
VLARWGHLEQIPDRPADWAVPLRNRPALAATLAARRDEARLFKDLATLRADRSLLPEADALRWTGPTEVFAEVCRRIDARGLAAAAARLAAGR